MAQVGLAMFIILAVVALGAIAALFLFVLATSTRDAYKGDHAALLVAGIFWVLLWILVAGLLMVAGGAMTLG